MKKFFCSILISVFMFVSSTALLAQFRTSVELWKREDDLVAKCDYHIASQGMSPIDNGATGVRYDVRYLSNHNIYQDGTKIDNPTDSRESYITHQISLHYRLNESLSFAILAPFSSHSESGSVAAAPHEDEHMIRTRSTLQHGGEHHEEVVGYHHYQSGFGDVVLMTRFKLAGNDHSFSLLAVGGVKVPTGSTDGRDDLGEFLHPHMQLGSGSVDPILGMNMLLGVSQEVSLTAGLLGSLPGKGVREYQFGAAVNYDLRLRYHLFGSDESQKFFVALGVTGEIHSKEKENGVVTDNTGGHTSYITPGVMYQPLEQLSFEVCYQYPFLHALNGTQLGASTYVTAGAQYFF